MTVIGNSLTKRMCLGIFWCDILSRQKLHTARLHVLRRLGRLIMEHNQFVRWDTDGCISSPLIVGEFDFISIRRQLLYDRANLPFNQAMLRKIYGQGNNIK